MKFILLVGAGGFVGSVARYLLSDAVQSKLLTSFPFGTMTVNLLGCFIIGIIYALSETANLAPEYRILIATGFCGGFTTFSSFSFESLTLLQDNQYLYAVLYAGFSLVLGLLAAFLGVILIRYLIA
jgi:CrcB protein